MTDPTGTPTYAITDATGAAVQSGNATITGGGAGTTTFAMDAVATLEKLTVTWTATVSGTSRTETDYVEIVGGFFFTLAEGRASDSSLSSTSTYTSAALETARLETEMECEAICDRAFVPRYQYVTLDGTGTSDVLLLHSEPDRTAGDVRTIRSVSMADTVDGTFTALTADELAALVVTDAGYLRRTDGDIWTEGDSNLRVEYEYGLDLPPADLVRASKARFRHWANFHKTGSVPENAESYSTPDGAAFRLAMSEAYKTGYLNVDGPYSRYSRRSSGTSTEGSSGPASRTLTYHPQRYSIYHR